MPESTSDGYLEESPPDAPVQPEVWGVFRDTGRQKRQKLIAQVRDTESSATVANILSDWEAFPEVMVYGPYLLIEASFDDVLTVLLPLTNWKDFMAKAGGLARERLLKELAAVRERVPVTKRVQGGVNWGAEDRTRLRWLIELVATVYDRDERLDDEAATERLLVLLAEAAKRCGSEVGPIESISLNREVSPAVVDSRMTVKADAAERVFDVDCSNITWAVIDTGIDRAHPAFSDGADGSRVVRTFDVDAGLKRLRDGQTDSRFVGRFDDAAWAVFQEGAEVSPRAAAGRAGDERLEHGTHVAGILGANYRADSGAGHRVHADAVEDREIKGVCPTIRLVDIRVFDKKMVATEFNVIIALAFVRWLNDRQRLGPADHIDGVNISLSVPFAVENYACGWTPVCQECDRLVNSGTVVVVAAGNSGFARGLKETLGGGFALVSISDPGNAEAVITVGSTDTHQPHRFGPTARSARGPTADGRHKPDLLAPGAKICGPAPGGGWQHLSGTSQAAPHVSGVAAMLLARFTELQGQPARIKRILCESATDLGRLQDFQGHGLLDALRALQSQ